MILFLREDDYKTQHRRVLMTKRKETYFAQDDRDRYILLYASRHSIRSQLIATKLCHLLDSTKLR